MANPNLGCTSGIKRAPRRQHVTRKLKQHLRGISASDADAIDGELQMRFAMIG